MSTVKIKTEPTTAAAAVEATVDVKVKLEPSLSTADIKQEQHSLGIDTKVESDSDADSEEDEVKSESNDEGDDGNDDTDQHQVSSTPKNQRKFICEHPGCGRWFSSNSYLKRHQHEHRLQTKLNMFGKSYTLTRHSLDDRWPCPIPDCNRTYKVVDNARKHIRKVHGNTIKQQQQQPQQLPAQKTQRIRYFVDVDSFYVNGVRCGYHKTVGVFICYECRLVPECLLTHLQQKHGYDAKSIDNSALPESAINASADPNINQHTSNPHIASTISQPYQPQHPDIVQGWLCVTTGCGFCGHTANKKRDHKRKAHHGEPISAVPALVLRLVYAKPSTCCFLITRIDQASDDVTTSGNRANWHKLDYDYNGLNVQNKSTDPSNQKRQWKCEYPNCEHVFNSSFLLSTHRHEHKCKAMIGVQGNAFTITRPSLDGRWSCPIPDCEAIYKTIDGARKHIIHVHNTLFKQKHANIEDDDNDSSQQQQIVKRRQQNHQYIKVDDFYIGGARCGYHKTIGVFICYECRLVPESLLTHLQQKHGYDEKFMDTAILPESTRNNGTDPNGNQYTSNPHLASAIRDPYQQHHQSIVQGWLCVTSGCGYCGYACWSKSDHKRKYHKSEQQLTAPALVLRLLFAKTQTMCFHITRLDTATTNVSSNNSTIQFTGACDVEDDGDELVLSDYGSDEDDIH